MSQPLLSLREVSRRFPAGEQDVTVLDRVSLDIHAGEMVAIIGSSGSGKSTLMNILGCLDQASSGNYQINGEDTARFEPDALARLRREHFGFIFQRYHLLPHLSALDNVAMPAVYAGLPLEARRERATQLLQRLGLGDKLHNRPSQLSGGQQQRVSIARALMNGGDIILADEPTGALDSRSGEEVMRILQELNAAGHTVILVTHDPQVAARARRIIEIHDGRILRDQHQDATPPATIPHQPKQRNPLAMLGQLAEAFKMALHAMLANRLRTLLTMLGIIIGITSVVSIITIGDAAQNYILTDLRSYGTNTIDVGRGSDWGDDKANSIRSLQAGDLTALANEPYVDSVTPITGTGVRGRVGNLDASIEVSGVSAQYFRVKGKTIASGLAFNADDVARQAQVAVIDERTRKKLFPNRDPIGEVILLGHVPVRVVGVMASRKSMFSDGQSLRVLIPYTTAGSHLLGRSHFDYLTIRVRDGQPPVLAEQALTRLLTQRHGSKDFFTENIDVAIRQVTTVSNTLSLLLTLVAVISLLVGGIGVMNIMLVSVTERTREIGIRMAVGARQQDVMQQFITESVLVCLVGGAIGVVLSWGLATVAGLLLPSWQIGLPGRAVLLAVVCASLIGLIFGYLPARRAARLNPIDALARE
ncbi:MacB family efflux pump subunit [Leeia aquatica]|uniref:MacB family efflux pump subunit n=1 Tax=Leeia aquatica TaxID=2725557 RepID=A0A847S8S6_9NEIS|nr:MacB family efflux pump subunit [Leeia aquatica]NLR76163.1 MacB family efflux pump subunit [Leeia aquatica]